jgi:hypothetical protein
MIEEQKSFCILCGDPMPSGEEVFKFHGYSGPCPKPRLKKSPMALYTKETLPTGGWRSYRKLLPTQMKRIDGPFQVETKEGVVICSDGYLAIDADGYPYPIASEIMAKAYEPVVQYETVGDDRPKHFAPLRGEEG